MNTEIAGNEFEVNLDDNKRLSYTSQTQYETIENGTPIEDNRLNCGLSVVIGKDDQGNMLVQNMALIPHMLIAGYSGAGKTAFIETILAKMALSNSPSEVRFIVYSSKLSDYILFKDVPHMYVPVVYDQIRFFGALQWSLVEIFKRLKSFSEVNAKDLEGFNKRCEKCLPHIYIVIDDYYDLIRFGDSSIVDTIKQILTNGRQAGVHLIIATSMPSAKVIQKDVLSGFPCRACFAVANKTDYRLVLNQNTAMGLESPGELIFKTYSSARKCRASYMDEDELHETLVAIKSKYPKDDIAFSNNLPEAFLNRYGAFSQCSIQEQNDTKQSETSGNYDEYLYPAVDVVLETGACSVSMLQRRIKLGYSRTSRLVDQMEELGIVGPYEGAKPRSVLIDREGWEQLKALLEQSETDVPSEPEDKPELRCKNDGNCEQDNRDEDMTVDTIDGRGGEQVCIQPFPKFDVGNASFSISDNKVYMSKVAQMKNGSGVFSSSFSAKAINEIVLKKPRLFSNGFFQFVFKDDADIVIRSSGCVDLDVSGFSALTKTPFNKNQASAIYSFLNQLSDDADLRITVL